MRLNEVLMRLLHRLRRWLSRSTEPMVLFPGLTILLLGVLWFNTIGLARLEYANARSATTATARELTETYEAQSVRALREIDRTLKFVAYTSAAKGYATTLSDLGANALLLPNLLFTVSIADADGNIHSSTSDGGPTNVADRDYFKAQRAQSVFAVGEPQRDPQTKAWNLAFSRRLNHADGSFAGAVIVSVDAAYFVSGYDQAKLGEQGFLGLLGTNGIFRASRSGAVVTAATALDYRTIVPETAEDQSGDDPTPVSLVVNSWDGVQRYTAARELYEFPLTVIVGLAEEEQLRPAAARAHSYLLRSGGVSLALIALMVLLGRLSWQLQKSRQRATQEQIEHARRIEYIAHHDGLTGLPNRGFFSTMLDQALAQAKRYEHQVAVLFLDLDRFKLINDNLGHDAGDALLKEVAHRLREAVRESDIVARLGGDEFVVLLPEKCDQESLEIVARRVLASVGKPYNLLGHEFRVTVSVGISRYPEDAPDEQSLLKNADTAMYRAKEKGRNNFQFYTESTGEHSLERLTIESALQTALERGEFGLYYQDQLDLKTCQVTGREALLRWQHPILGTILPMQFIPIAEETGLILPIGKWVIETACRDCMASQQTTGQPLTVSVNLTASQFSDENLPRDLTNILDKTGIAPPRLELSVTETVLLANVDHAVSVLGKIRALGVRVAIDNFGASYSSLSTLNKFRFDTVNIDGSVIRDCAHNPEDKKLTEAAIAMGRQLAFTVVAEGVETQAQAELLRDIACDKAQGFYFGHPAPPNSDGGSV